MKPERPLSTPGDWAAIGPHEEAGRLLAGLAAPWWIGGGWAIDLAFGRRTRDHGDMDIAVRRADQPALARTLTGWDIHVAAAGVLTPWRRGDWLEGGARHQLWTRPTPAAPWALEILLEEGEDRWVYRRDRAVTLPWSSFGRLTPDGIPFVALPVVLLYKAARPDEPKTARDADEALPALSRADRAWLASALTDTHPGHPWLARL